VTLYSGKALLSSLYIKGNPIAFPEELEISSAFIDVDNNLYQNKNQSKYLFFLIIF